jgi:hypothetical protein
MAGMHLQEPAQGGAADGASSAPRSGCSRGPAAPRGGRCRAHGMALGRVAGAASAAGPPRGRCNRLAGATATGPRANAPRPRPPPPPPPLRAPPCGPPAHRRRRGRARPRARRRARAPGADRIAGAAARRARRGRAGSSAAAAARGGAAAGRARRGGAAAARPAPASAAAAAAAGLARRRQPRVGRQRRRPARARARRRRRRRRRQGRAARQLAQRQHLHDQLLQGARPGGEGGGEGEWEGRRVQLCSSPAAPAPADASPPQPPTPNPTSPHPTPPCAPRAPTPPARPRPQVLPCQRRTRHQWRSCPFVHEGELVRRRSLAEVPYSAVMCAYVRLGQPCPHGEACLNAHNVFELWLHHSRFRTQLCSDGAACRRSVSCGPARVGGRGRGWRARATRPRDPARRPRQGRGPRRGRACCCPRAARPPDQGPRAAGPP